MSESFGVDAFGIFEGGGVKGLAHIGALAAARRRRVRFCGVAGTSAGAIVAALVAVGYRADELYDPSRDGNKGIFDFDFLEFIERAAWHELLALNTNGRKQYGWGAVTEPGKRNLLKLGWKTYWFYKRHRGIIDPLLTDRGIFNTEKFVAWLDPLLADKLLETRPQLRAELGRNKVRFRHIEMPLKILATDLTKQSFKLFSKDEDGEQTVADAVAASISIPLIFKPAVCGGPGEVSELVDGGLLSNFPAWVFDQERLSRPMMRTFGFKFAPTRSPIDEDPGLFRFLRNLTLTAVYGGEHLQVRQVPNLHIIPLRVTTNMLQFDLSREEKDELYERGKNCARDAFADRFGWVAPEDPRLTTLFEAAHRAVTERLGRPALRLRLCILLPHGLYKNGAEINYTQLKVQYTYNFWPEDADDQLELPMKAGVAGRCWQDRHPTVGDLRKAKSLYQSDWNMTKYQQALVRPALKSCLCLPILEDTASDGHDPGEDSVIGVFAIDSDEDLVADFKTNEAVVETALAYAKIFRELLRF